MLERFLDDLQANVDKLKERFAPRRKPHGVAYRKWRWRLAFPRGCRKGRASLGVLEDNISNIVYGLQDATGRTISLAATAHSFIAGLGVIW